MNRAIANLDSKALSNVHQYSLDILKSTGIRFPCETALGVFKKHGLRVSGETVFFRNTHIEKALESALQSFDILARNPEKSITVGGNNYVMALGYGPPFII